MKVAILSFYSGLVSRGVETFVSEISLRLSHQCQLQVYSAVSVGMPVKLPPGGQKNVSQYLFLDPVSRQIKQFTKKVLAELGTKPPDILMPLNNGWMSWLSKRFCQRSKTRLVLVGFSGIGWDDKVNLWLKPDVFVACTQAQKGWAKKIKPQQRVEVINLGVDVDRFKTEGKKLKLELIRPIVLCVAGQELSKRVDLAIQAVSRLPQTSLLVVGEQRPEIKQLGERLLGERFRNIQVDYGRLDAVYRSCQVYTLPSGGSEAYGVSILEALATGLPVVVNDDPIRRELVGEAGIVVDPTDTTAYVSALKQALKSTDSNRYRQQAKKFSWDKIAQEYLKLWSSLV